MGKYPMPSSIYGVAGKFIVRRGHSQQMKQSPSETYVAWSPGGDGSCPRWVSNVLEDGAGGGNVARQGAPFVDRAVWMSR